MNPTLIHLAKYIIYFAPKSLKTRLNAMAERRRLNEAMQRMKRTKVTIDQINGILDQIDFNRPVILHTSIINIGKVKGGAKALTDAILDHCKLDSQPLIVSALPFFGQFAAYIKSCGTFDVRSAPIAMGAVNERIAALEGATRSIHPTHSVVAVGKGAGRYTSSHHLDKTPFGPNSPYWKLVKAHGHALMLGATINNLTAVHVLEDALGAEMPLDPYKTERYTIDCIDADGKHLSVETPVHHPLRSIPRSLDYMLDDGLRLGYIKQWPIGEACIMDIDIHRLLERQLQLMQEGRSMYGKCKKRVYRPLDDYLDARH